MWRLLSRYTLLLLVALTLSCSSVSQDPGTSIRPTPGLLRSQDDKRWVINHRYSVLRVGYDGGHGSGFGFYQGGDYTLVATAAHVVRPAGLGGTMLVEWLDLRRSRRTAEGQVMLVHPKEDVAIVKVQGLEVPILPVQSWSKLGGVLITGFPKDIYPPSVTIGENQGKKHPGFISTNAPAWFGNSGGPLLDIKTGCVIGILVHLHGDREGPLSDMNCSVPVGVVLALAKSTMEGE